jgi:ABC-2 type transport system ATP-binding protein
MEETLAVDVQQITKNYAGFEALKGFDLKIKKGEIFGLLGPNGAGKSTLIGILTGSVNKSSGDVKIFGFDVESDYIVTRKKTGVVPQETISDGFFTIKQIMEFQSGFYGIKDNSERIERILKKLTLWEKRDVPVQSLSGGMKRRLLVAKSMVHDPELLILDEPTAGVDVYLRKHLWDYVKEINDSGVTVLLTSHYIYEVEALANRVAIVDHGKLVCVDTSKSILEKYKAKDLEDAFIKITGKSCLEEKECEE